MATLTPSTQTSPAGTNEPTQLTRWSLWMIPTFVVVYLATSFVGLYVVLPLLGLNEGDIFLFADSVGGWVAAAVGWLLLAAPPIAGVWLAIRALRQGARLGARAALAGNVLVTLLVAYIVFDEIRLAYFPQITFPFSG